VSEEPAVDAEVLAELQGLGGPDDPGFLPGLVREFLKHVDAAVPDLRRAVAAGDSKALERVAHGLKGSSGNLGAKRLSRLSTELQDDGRNGRAAAAGSRVEALAAEAERVREALKPYAGSA
jgi:HPt (histidine-containing phosphotransfer) domain-containing protein